MIENASKTKFIYTTKKLKTTITQAFKKKLCEVKVLMREDLIDFKSIDKFQNIRKTFKIKTKWVKVFENGPSKICGRQLLKNLK